MLKALGKLWFYKKAPKKTFFLLHPLKSMKLLTSSAVAVPVAFWLGKKLSKGR